MKYYVESLQHYLGLSYEMDINLKFGIATFSIWINALSSCKECRPRSDCPVWQSDHCLHCLPVLVTDICGNVGTGLSCQNSYCYLVYEILHFSNRLYAKTLPALPKLKLKKKSRSSHFFFLQKKNTSSLEFIWKTSQILLDWCLYCQLTLS